MRDLNYQLKTLCEKHRDGAYGTQDARARSLDQMANQLFDLGYRQMKGAKSLKEKHVLALVKHWKETDVTAATIKNRMSHLRWVAKRVGLPHLVQRDNEDYGIEKRQYSTNVDKALVFEAVKLAAIEDRHVQVSALLQRDFGLRREEAMKFQIRYADKGDRIALKASWTKGGRAREIPVRTEAQRETLERVRALSPLGSLIPASRSYVQHLKVFEREMANVGLGRTHGARHLYAQQRYQELTGWKSPAAGGPTSRELSDLQKTQDHSARLTISRELGHEREQITVVYLGR